MTKSFDDVWTEEKLHYLKEGAVPRRNFISVLITLNLAIYAGIYTLDPVSPFSVNPVKFFLIFTLLVINVGIMLLYLRDHNLNKINDYYFRKLSDSKLTDDFKKTQEQIKKADKMKGVNWLVISVLLSYFASVPIALLITILLAFFLKELSASYWIFSLFLFSWVLFWCLFLDCKSFKSE